MTTKEFAGQQIVTVDTMPAAGILFHLQHLLHLVEKRIADNAWDGALYTNIAVNINPAIAFVYQKPVEAAAAPRFSDAGSQTPGVEIPDDIYERFAGGHPAIDFADNLVLRGIKLKRQIGSSLVAIGEQAVCLCLHGIVQQPAPDILRHILGVKLVHVHHAAQSKPPGGGIVKVLCGIENPDAELIKPGLVHHGLQHIAANPVRLPGNDELEATLLGVPHHLLEGWPPVGFAADGPVGIGVYDGKPHLGGVLHALGHLLLNAGIFLRMAAIPGIDNTDAAGSSAGRFGFCGFPCHIRYLCDKKTAAPLKGNEKSGESPPKERHWPRAFVHKCG